MSIRHYPDTMKAPNLQVWNNAAFDNGDSEDSAAIKASWSPMRPMFFNQSESLESDNSKENQSPEMAKSPASIKSPVPFKLLHQNGATGNSQAKPSKIPLKQGIPVTPSVGLKKTGTEDEVLDEKKIDAEIEEIEMEISRLSSKLKALRLEKAERNAKAAERRGRIVPAKFMDQKQSAKNLGFYKTEEPMSAGTRVQRRGKSLGPTEIVAGARSRQLSKQEITPVQPMQSRRKSCFWKLQDIDEEKVTKERGKCLSVSPKSRRTASKTQAPRQAATTVGAKTVGKKEDRILSSIQPKKLFKDGEKSVPAKKPLKSGRVVASRYSQITQPAGNSAMRKRSLPGNVDDDEKRMDKKRSSSVGRSRGVLREMGWGSAAESRAKKRWEIPSEVVIHRSEEDESSSFITQMPDLLPKIRAVRCNFESPRDSGPAKRVSELIGRRSYFCTEEEEEGAPSICQGLNFAEVEEK
ncbi:uncharacterized protein LOC131148746 [Malania oleifera]|uniref:uncharacterized protein LOC131148746 n=1 Tax=Malania oleifera TaxID=397392 RepID=UPI0025AD9D65|nr:uncharacterized protein LOC131148746 [Malania oleifera]